MRSVKSMQIAKTGYIAASALFCALGILLIVKPDFSLKALGIICGAVLIVFGIIKIIGYFSKDLFRLAFQYDLAFGILLIMLGLVILMRPANLFHFLCLVFGISVLSDSLFKVQIAVDAKRFGLKYWLLILSVAVITGVFGLVLVFRPTESTLTLTVLLGICLAFEGILNLSTVLTSVKIIRHQVPDCYDAEFTEIKED